jgi:TMEM175 potassium channel family protein
MEARGPGGLLSPATGEPNPNGRLEAFSDGVFAIAITLLVIDFAVPSPENIGSDMDLWAALGHMAPVVFSFVLSFTVILITWFNHHAALRLVDRSSPSFLYANGLLLLTVAIIPFPTALLGEYLLTDHSAPAVVVYNAVLSLQAVGWVLLSEAALRGNLTRNATSRASMRVNNRNGYFAMLLYAALAGLAFWFPHMIAALTTLTWIFWLVHGIRIKHEEA